jgi:hypothetical protein
MQTNFSGEAFDIIIQGGQSNSQGCGLSPVESPFVPCLDILQMDSDLVITTAREQVWDNESVGNLSLSFADEYIKSGRLKEGRKLLILMAAVGGTGFCDNRWGQNDDLFLKMTEMIKTAHALNPANRPVVFLWHQGETDTANPVRDVHYQNLHTLVSEVREAVECDDLPFIAGDFVHQWKTENITVCEPIITAIKDVCADIDHAAFVETAGLQSNDEKIGNGDAIHFSREALYELGSKYYSAFCRVSLA